jgi:hypothetical protein
VECVLSWLVDHIWPHLVILLTALPLGRWIKYRFRDRAVQRAIEAKTALRITDGRFSIEVSPKALAENAARRSPVHALQRRKTRRRRARRKHVT